MKVNLGKYKKNGATRTEKIQIDPWDSWDAFSTIGLIVAPLLKSLKESEPGTPMFCFPDDIGFAPTEEQEAAAEKKWEDILDKMIFSFEEAAKSNEENILLAKYYGDKWDKFESNFLSYTEEKKLLDAKVQEGLDLFAKHFHSLWS